MNPTLKASNLTVRLRLGSEVVTVVDRLSLTLERGKTLGLVGESGCGKSMTALSLLRVLPEPPALPPEGEVLFQGVDLIKLSEKKMRKIRGAKISMIFQDPGSALNPVYSIGNQLVEVAELHLGLGASEAVELAEQVLDDVGIPSPKECLLEYPHQLSGGMRQRVMIAMALMCEPDVLIADEPTTALDVTVQAQVLRLMRELQEKKGTALLLITHDMGVIAEMADEVVVMYASQEMERAPVVDLFDNMAHPYTQALFRALPQRQKPHQKLEQIHGTVPPVGHLPSGCPFHPRCPFVMPVCRQGEVPDFVTGDDHTARCWLHKGEE